MGDTPGVFTDAQFVGLVLQLPVTISFVPEGLDKPVYFLIESTEVEIFGGKRHPILWDWMPGDKLPTPAGFINDVDFTPGKPELHYIEIAPDLATVGKHTITILVNPEIAAGMKDDFILRRLEADNQIGAKFGW